MDLNFCRAAFRGGFVGKNDLSCRASVKFLSGGVDPHFGREYNYASGGENRQAEVEFRGH